MVFSKELAGVNPTMRGHSKTNLADSIHLQVLFVLHTVFFDQSVLAVPLCE
jgi:hypothetical protein